MVVIRAHVEGGVIVPDEPVALTPQSQVVVLLDTDNPAAFAELERQTREYYQALGADKDDQDWGRAVAPESKSAWDEE